jgi:phospholipid/cholesterol/gamma-HCH transport system substrate-binding protein
MSKTRLELKVGIFVFVGLVLLAALVLQFSKGMTLFRPTYTLFLKAENVGGLKVHSFVLMAGVQVGTVSGIRLGPQGTNVTIDLKLFKEYQIHRDARFVIEQSGFLGDQYVAVMPTQNKDGVFGDHDEAETEAPFNMQEVARAAGGFLKRVDETANRLNEAINDVRRLVLNEKTLTNLSTSVGNLRVVSERALVAVADLDALLTTNGPAFSTSGSNLVFFSQQLNGFAEGLSGVVRTNAPDLNSAVKNIESSTVTLKTVMDELQAGKGLAGNLLKNEELARSVSQIATNLTITTSNLNRLGLWGVLWQKKPAKSESRVPKHERLETPKSSER